MISPAAKMCWPRMLVAARGLAVKVAVRVAATVGVTMGIIVGFAACDGADGPDAAPAEGVTMQVDTVDGVEVREARGTPEQWDLEPAFQVGELDGPDAEVFQSVASLALAEDGSLWVADGGGSGAQDIRVFDAEGSHVRTVGREGQGPGEFQTLHSLTWVGADTLAALDPGNARIGLLDREGEWLGQWRYEANITGPSRLIRFYPAARDEAYAYHVTWGEGTGGGTVRSLVPLPPDAPRDTLALPDEDSPVPTAVLCEQEGIIRSFAIHAAGRWLDQPVPGGRLARAWGPEYWVEIRDPDGEVDHALRRDPDPAPVDPEAWEEAMASYFDFRDEHGASGCDPADPDPPDHRPALRELLTDRDGALWLEVEDAQGRRFDIYDPDGELVAEVPDVPERNEGVPPSIADDRLALVTADDLGVERVEVFQIRRPE